jgi:hypothetical protein
MLSRKKKEKESEKTTSRMREKKILANPTSDKELMSRMYGSFYNSSIKSGKRT